jgi:hypothetical protein
VASVRRCAPTFPNTLGLLRSIGSLACARRSASSSRPAGTVTVLQSRPAARSASACPATRASTAVIVRCAGLVRVMPWRRSTPSAASSRDRHASASLGSTGRSAAKSRSPCRERCSTAVVQRGKQRWSWRPALVSRARVRSASRSDGLVPHPPGVSGRPEHVETAAGSSPAASKAEVNRSLLGFEDQGLRAASSPPPARRVSRSPRARRGAYAVRRSVRRGPA